MANEEQEQREREKREKRVYDNWRRLIRGLLIRERLQAKYFRNVTEDDLPPVIDGAEKEVSQTSLSNKNEKSTKKPTTNKRKKKWFLPFAYLIVLPLKFSINMLLLL